MTPPKLTLADLGRATAAGEALTMVTAYDFHSARIADAAGIELLLVGDSAAQVMLGYPSTTRVSMNEMLMLAAAVVRGTSRAFVIGDLPFMSYQTSDELAVTNAGRFVAEAGVDAVKLEGSGPAIDRIHAIVQAGIPAIGHLGLTPQSATLLGGYRAQARTSERAVQLLHDAEAIEQAGASMLVLEAVPAGVARTVAEHLTIPVIGIGAGADVDGQVLVWHDALGITPGKLPRFVETFAEVGAVMQSGLERYKDSVRARSFPAEAHTYAMPDGEWDAFESATRTLK
jgi:3-methyl-2-oxobutanoate hydroxymethyltransferase